MVKATGSIYAESTPSYEEAVHKKREREQGETDGTRTVVVVPDVVFSFSQTEAAWRKERRRHSEGEEKTRDAGKESEKAGREYIQPRASTYIPFHYLLGEAGRTESF